MPNIIVTTIEKAGGDLVFNDTFSIPKDKVTIVKRDAGFCTCTFDQKYYSDTYDFHIETFQIFWENVTKPVGVSSNDELFIRLVNLK